MDEVHSPFVVTQREVGNSPRTWQFPTLNSPPSPALLKGETLAHQLPSDLKLFPSSQAILRTITYIVLNANV
jgi:hypothetical protein